MTNAEKLEIIKEILESASLKCGNCKMYDCSNCSMCHDCATLDNIRIINVIKNDKDSNEMKG